MSTPIFIFGLNMSDYLFLRIHPYFSDKITAIQPNRMGGRNAGWKSKDEFSAIQLEYSLLYHFFPKLYFGLTSLSFTINANATVVKKEKIANTNAGFVISLFPINTPVTNKARVVF